MEMNADWALPDAEPSVMSHNNYKTIHNWYSFFDSPIIETFVFQCKHNLFGPLMKCDIYDGQPPHCTRRDLVGLISHGHKTTKHDMHWYGFTTLPDLTTTLSADCDKITKMV